jgi:hypothetical protein
MVCTEYRRSAFGAQRHGGHMAIWLADGIGENGYLAADAAYLVEAFEGALKELGLDRNDPATLVVGVAMLLVAVGAVVFLVAWYRSRKN